MGSLGALISANNTNKSSLLSNSSGDCWYSNSKIQNLVEFIGIAGLAGKGLSEVGSLWASVKSYKAASGNKSGVITGSIFTYGKDNQTDYAEQAIKEIDETLTATNKELENKNTRKNELENGTNSVNALQTTFKNATNDYDNSVKSCENLRTKLLKATNKEEKSKLEKEIKQQEDVINQKAKAKTEAETAYKNAQAELDKLPDEIDTLKTTIEKLEKQKAEFEALDNANGCSAERATSATANDKNLIKDKTFQMENARQLINEFASAKRAYEQNPTNAGKNELKRIAKKFNDEYDNGNGQAENNTTIDNAKKVIDDYIKDLDKKK